MKPQATIRSPSIVVHKDALTQGDLYDGDGLIRAFRGVFEVETEEPAVIILSKNRWRARMHPL
jgi:hypothetical protein